MESKTWGISNSELQLYDVDMALDHLESAWRLKKVVAIEPAEGRGGEYYCPFIIIMTKTSGKKFVDRRPSTRSQFAYKTDARTRKPTLAKRRGAGTEKKTSTPDSDR